MRTFEALAAISIPVLVAALVGCTTGVAAGIPDVPVDDSTETTAKSNATADSDRSIPKPSPSWTFFIYAQGDNGRSPALAADLARIKEARLGANITVVVLADWNAGTLDASGQPLFATGTDQYTFRGGKSATIVHDEVEHDFDDPTVMSNSIARTFRDHPADHHGLIIWSRGAGDSNHVLGADLQDDARPFATGMSISAMKSAIRDGLTGAGLSGDRSLDMLGFDLASPGRIEDAYAMRDFAKVYVSNAAQDGNGAWAYADAFGFTTTNPSASAKDMVAFEAKAWDTQAAASHSLPRAHIAFDTTKLEDVARATDSLVRAIHATPSSMSRVAAAASAATTDAGGVGRRPDYARFVATLANGSNMGIVTTAAANASEHVANAFIGTPAPAGFSVGLPTPKTITNQWYNDYVAASQEWSTASRWSHFLVAWAAPQDPAIPSVEASIIDDSSDPGSTGSMIHVEQSSTSDGSMKASLFMKQTNGGGDIFFGDVASRSFAGNQAMISWNKRIGAIANQPARAISQPTFAGARTALAGRVTLGSVQKDAAVIITDGATSNVFVIDPEHNGPVVNAAELLMIDPAATFTPSITQVQGEAKPAIYGTPIAITKAGVLLGTVAMQPGNYELRVDVRNIWGNGGLAMQAFSIAPL